MLGNPYGPANTNDQQELKKDRKSLINEATELMNIFDLILQKSQCCKTNLTNKTNKTN